MDFLTDVPQFSEKQTCGIPVSSKFSLQEWKIEPCKKKCKREKETIPSHYTGCSIGYNNPKKGFRKHFQKDDVCQFVPSFPPTVPAKFGGVYVKKKHDIPTKEHRFLGESPSNSQVGLQPLRFWTSVCGQLSSRLW